jgi:hypothetical protein
MLLEEVLAQLLFARAAVLPHHSVPQVLRPWLARCEGSLEAPEAPDGVLRPVNSMAHVVREQNGVRGQNALTTL